MLCSLLPLQAMANGVDYSAGFVPEAPKGFQAISGQDFEICYGPGSEGDIDEVADAASAAYASVHAFFRGAPFHPTIIVASAHEEYEEILNAGSLPEYSVSSGWGDGSRSAIVIKRPDAVPNFRVAMAHEMAHIATRSYIRGYKYALPEWFSEGLAVYVSGDLPGAKMGMVEDNCVNGTLMSIDELERVHRLSATDNVTADRVSLAYMQSGLLVKYIADKYGNESLLQVMDHFGPIGDLDSVFSSVIGDTPNEVNFQWQKELKRELDARDGRILEQSVHGYVVDHHGRPMANETVSFTALRNDSPVQGTVYTAVTGEAGQYSANVTYGPLKVVSEKPEYAGFNDTITVDRGRSMFLNVTLNGTALEERLAREKAERDRRNMILGGSGIAIVCIMAAGFVYIRRRRSE
ncbi:peptidase MA family metallohydrolase [Methanocella paludicola]|nr:carboxypeptidase regulatory-like domain-containing protein [Methanocella paludicola]